MNRKLDGLARTGLLCLGLMWGMGAAVLAADGRWDPGFGEGGVASIRESAQGEPENARLRLIRSTPDGGVLVFSSTSGLGTGSDVVIDKFDANGRPDKSFGNAGRAIHDINRLANVVRDVRVLADGRFVLVQQCAQRSSLHLDLCVARFESSGKLDINFADGGVLVANYALENRVYATVDASLQVDSSGAIWVGVRLLYESWNDFEYFVRLLSLNEKGERLLAKEQAFQSGVSGLGRVYSVITGLDHQQRLLLVVDGGGLGTKVHRLLPTGGFDNSFVSDLSAMENSPGVSWVGGDASGRVWLEYQRSYSSPARVFFGIARLLADGKKDLSFGSNGVWKGTPLPEHSHYVRDVRLTDGGIEFLMRAIKTNSPEQYQFFRIDGAGVLQNQSTYSVTTPSTHAHIGALRSASGRLLVMESTVTGQDVPSRIRAFSSDGQVDQQFGVGGLAEISALSASPFTFDMQSAVSGTTMLVTGRGFAFVAAANGQFQRLPASQMVRTKQQKTYASAADRDGKRYLLSEPLVSKRPVELAISRVDAQGNLDTTFADQGMAKFAPIPLANCSNSYIEQAHLAVDQGIHVAVMMYCLDSEPFSHKTLLIRLDGTGKPDSAFGLNGVQTVASLSAGETCGNQAVPVEAKASLRLAMDSQGRPVVAVAWCEGPLGYENLKVYRYTREGKLDQSFGNQGAAVGHLWGGLIGALVADQNDSWWLVSNAFYEGRPYITRIAGNGRVDRDPFSPSGFDGRSAAGSFRVFDAVKDAKGRWYFVGAAGLQKSTVPQRAAVARLEVSGELDSSFGQSGRMVLENGVSDGAFYGAKLSVDGSSLTVWGRCQDTACIAKLDTASGQLASTSATLDFGTVAANTSVEKTWTLENVGDGMLRLTSVKLEAPFTQTHDCAAGLAKGQKCTVKFTLRTNEAGDFQRSATLETSAGNLTLQLRAKVEAATTGGNSGGGSSSGGGGSAAVLLALVLVAGKRRRVCN